MRAQLLSDRFVLNFEMRPLNLYKHAYRSGRKDD